VNSGNLSLFLLAALIIAVVPGPGIFYVMGRTLSDGRRTGVASTLGTALGGCVHIVAGAMGISAIILASAEFFTTLKLIGAFYLVWIGVRTFREAGRQLPQLSGSIGARRALREGILVESLNPKTAAFFLAFIPQFLDSTESHPALHFIALGMISVTLNTLADVIVVAMAAGVRANLSRRPNFILRVQQGAGLLMTGLGASLALARRAPSA
jgi:threonine/homoserine/homoserine lactone efflux protein